MAERYRALRVGPAASDLDVGPVISRRQKGVIEHFLGLARDGGLAFAAVEPVALVVPALAWGGGLGAALLIGAAAGLLPALRAARMSPTQALWSR